MRFSARLDTRLVAVIRTADVEQSSIADIWRVAGETADRPGLCRPGYHSVLRLVRDERARRAARQAAIVDAIDELWSYTGTDYETLLRRLAETRRR